MARIYPFRAFRYQTEKAGTSLQHLVTQPYDKITPAMQERYYGLGPYNLVPLEKGKPQPGDNGENVYTRAARWLEETIRAGALGREAQPALYPYFQEYTAPGTKERRTRKGFIALGQIEDYAAGVIHRHEQTLSGPQADRLELLRRTRAHTGQLFMIYTDPVGEVDRVLEAAARQLPPQTVEDEYRAVHRLWAVTHPHTLPPPHRVVANPPIFRSAAFREKAAPYFDWYASPAGGDDKDAARRRLLQDLTERGAERPSFGVFAAGESAYYLFLLKVNADLARLLPEVSPRQRGLDLVVLHRLLLERCLGLTEESIRKESNLRYLRGAEEATGSVESGDPSGGLGTRAQVALLVNPIR